MKTDTQKSIEEQALAFKVGDEKALSFFYHEVHPALAFFAYKFVEDRMLAEEIASNAFIKIWKFHWKFDSYPDIRAYLYTIVRNECSDILRLKHRKMVVPRETLPLVISNETAFDNLVRSELSRLISSALQKISPTSRKILTLQYIEGMSTSEIATELNVSPITVRTLKARGLKKLRTILLHPLLLATIIFLKDLSSFL